MKRRAPASFKDLFVWQRGIALALEIYSVTKSFPEHETHGLVSRLRLAAIAIPAKIANGHGRGRVMDFVMLLGIALSAAQVVETHLVIARELGYVTQSDVSRSLLLAQEISRLLEELLYSLDGVEPGEALS